MSTLALLLLISGQALRPIPYFDPMGRKPASYEEYAAVQRAAPLQAQTVLRSPGDGRYDRLVVVLVNSTLYAALPDDIATWVADVSGQGFTVKVIATSGGRATGLRQVLQAHRDSGLVGAMMLGDLPVAWWEDGSYGEDYPIDLFFSDLNGTFADNDGDGMYDAHSGSTQPDIWVGRIHASRLTYGTEVQLVKDYLRRNHEYRTGQLAVPRRGLVYNEVTWYPNNHGMNNLYSDVTVFNDANTTTAYHYRNQLRQGYEFVHVIAHSSPWVHTFFLAGDAPGGGSVFNFEVPALAPNAAFYFINGCMCGRFTEKDCLCNWYLFARPWAQAVIASSQLMYGVDNLASVYQAFSRDSCLGAAFMTWYRTNYSSFRGTLILGDPTLKPARFERGLARVVPPQYVPSAPLDWTEQVVDTSNFVNGNPDIGCSQGRLRLVFDSGRIVRSDNYFTSFDGVHFTRPESIAWHDYYDLFPACATDAAGRFWVVWQSFRDYSSYEHFQLFSSFYYNGAWSPVQRIGPTAGYHDVQAAVASGTDNVTWCAFKSWRNGQGDIWVSSAAGGGAWASPTRLTTDSLDQLDPCVVVDRDNRPWVFWTSLVNGRWQLQGRYYASGWQPAFTLDTIGDNAGPRAAIDVQGRLWVVWHKAQGGQADVYYSCREDSTWSAPAALAATAADELLPDVCAGPDGSVRACWQGKSMMGSWDIFTSNYAGGWTTPEPVTSDMADDFDPVIETDAGGNVWIAWASNRRSFWNICAARAPLTGTQEQPSANPLSIAASPNPFTRGAVFTGPERFRVGIYAPDGRRLEVIEARSGRVAWVPKDRPRGVFLARVLSPGMPGTAPLKLVYVE